MERNNSAEKIRDQARVLMKSPKWKMPGQPLHQFSPVSFSLIFENPHFIIDDNCEGFWCSNGTCSEHGKAILKYYREYLNDFEIEDISSGMNVLYLPLKAIEQRTSQGLYQFGIEDEYYTTIQDDHLLYRFQMTRELGYGTYGLTVSAFDHKSKKKVALKIFRCGINYDKCARHEINVLRFLNRRDKADEKNILRSFGYFYFRSHSCLAYELLHVDLFVLQDSYKEGLPLNNVHTIIKSVLTGLEYIHSFGLIHADLKPGNIALKSAGSFECKIIDFGLCIQERYCKTPIKIQSPAYRAPEVHILAPYNHKVDIWSLGCIAVDMARGKHIFRGEDELSLMNDIVQFLGLPPKYVMDAAKDLSKFFDVTPSGTVFKTLPDQPDCQPKSKNLEDSLRLKKDHPFVHFIKKCLVMDPRKRSTAAQLLTHPWMKKGGEVSTSNFLLGCLPL